MPQPCISDSHWVIKASFSPACGCSCQAVTLCSHLATGAPSLNRCGTHAISDLQLYCHPHPQGGSALTEMQLGGAGEAGEAAGAALQALTCYNRPARVAYLRELVQALLDGKAQARAP